MVLRAFGCHPLPRPPDRPPIVRGRRFPGLLPAWSAAGEGGRAMTAACFEETARLLPRPCGIQCRDELCARARERAPCLPLCPVLRVPLLLRSASALLRALCLNAWPGRITRPYCVENCSPASSFAGLLSCRFGLNRACALRCIVRTRSRVSVVAGFLTPPYSFGKVVGQLNVAFCLPS